STPGTTLSQMPDRSRGRSGWRVGSQSLKSPMTERCSAFGAHTAKYTPPSTGCAPSFSQRRWGGPSLERERAWSLSRVGASGTRSPFLADRRSAGDARRVPEIRPERGAPRPGRGLPWRPVGSRSASRMRPLFDLISIGDLIDIMLVTTLVYTAVVWIRRTQAAFV